MDSSIKVSYLNGDFTVDLVTNSYLCYCSKKPKGHGIQHATSLRRHAKEVDHIALSKASDDCLNQGMSFFSTCILLFLTIIVFCCPKVISKVMVLSTNDQRKFLLFFFYPKTLITV